jgi:hypothetical protein
MRHQAALARGAQHGQAADGALRPQDRRFFEGRNQSNALPIYGCAAADAQPVRRLGNVVGTPAFHEQLVGVAGAGRAPSVVPVPVLLAWFDGSWLGVPVLGSVIVC